MHQPLCKKTHGFWAHPLIASLQHPNLSADHRKFRASRWDLPLVPLVPLLITGWWFQPSIVVNILFIMDNNNGYYMVNDG